STSIKNVCYLTGEDNNIKHIVFGGYDRTIRNITDFEWGQKQSLEIPQKIKVDEIKESKKTDLASEIAKIKEIPTSMREHIFNYFQEHGYLKNLMEELLNQGYSEDAILDEFALLKTQKSVVYEKVTYPVWSLPSEEVEKEMPKEVEAEVIVEEQLKPKVQPLVIEETVTPKKEKLRAALDNEPKAKVSAGGSLGNTIIEYLKEMKLVATKTQIINDIKEIGFSDTEIDKEINNLKEQGKIQYSRAKPKGWSLTG
ncbi:MAG: hypothetical protein R3255_06230, partial [Candidatus Lokiarchaeia archaeon]|nr:hypothetical protein [Candidatus Lokiarchaeia archaeon]